MDPSTILEKALHEAADRPDEGATQGQIHRNRSKHLVEKLASILRLENAQSPSIRVFSKHCDKNRRAFGLNELLFDIMVCDTDTVSSPQHSTPLTYITRGLWAIESEFAEDSRQALYDFNKLVLSSCENQLFIGPQVHEEDKFIATLLPSAQQCRGNVFIALIPHPREWQILPLEVHLWQLVSGQWQQWKG